MNECARSIIHKNKVKIETKTIMLESSYYSPPHTFQKHTWVCIYGTMTRLSVDRGSSQYYDEEGGKKRLTTTTTTTTTNEAAEFDPKTATTTKITAAATTAAATDADDDYIFQKIKI